MLSINFKKSFICIISLTLLQCGGIIEGEESQDYCMDVKKHAMKDGWSKTGNLTSGLTQVGQYTMQAKFTAEEGGSGAQYYTIQFGIQQPPRNAVFDAVAEILWSTNGTDVRRLVSIGNGTVISGTAQFAKVSVWDRSKALLDFLGETGEIYRVDTLVTPGCRPSDQMPPRLFPETEVVGGVPVNQGGLFTIAAATNQQVTIPQNAGVISLKADVASQFGSAPPVEGDTQIVFTDASGTVILGMFDPLSTDDWVPVPPSAKFMTLQNLTVAKTIQYFVAYGIEG